MSVKNDLKHGNFLKEWRKKYSFSQQRLADMLRLSRTWISAMEYQDKAPDYIVALLYCLTAYAQQGMEVPDCDWIETCFNYAGWAMIHPEEFPQWTDPDYQDLNYQDDIEWFYDPWLGSYYYDLDEPIE